jgi:hypothetical protein
MISCGEIWACSAQGRLGAKPFSSRAAARRVDDTMKVRLHATRTHSRPGVIALFCCVSRASWFRMNISGLVERKTHQGKITTDIGISRLPDTGVIYREQASDRAHDTLVMSDSVGTSHMPAFTGNRDLETSH